MFNVCPQCGEYCVEKTIDLSGPYAICPFCHHPHPFLRHPLFLITGPSGAGKTTVCIELVSQLHECVVMDSDILWGAFPDTAEPLPTYQDVWLRVAKNIGQAGRPVVLCGTALPEQFESCPERRYFSTLHYLALVCDETVLRARLLLRPAWRQSGSPDVLERMASFNHWLKEHASETTPPMTLYDTSSQSLEETTRAIGSWIRERL